MFRKILLPLDGSQLSEGIIPYASQLAAGLGAKLTVLYVAQPATGGRRAPAPSVTRVPEGTVMAVKDYLQEAEARLKQGGAPQVASQVVAGEPAPEIVRLAGAGGYDLIAMATHGRSGLGRWVFGSTTDKVLHSTALPMLLIRPKPSGQGQPAPRPINTLVVPLDGSSLAENVMPVAEGLSRWMTLKMAVLRIVPSVGMLYAGFEPYAYDPALDKDLDKLAGQYLKNVTEGLQRQGVQATAHQLRGYAASQIISFAEGMPGSMVVMSTHGRSGVGRWLLGSVADRVVRSSSEPMLLIRATPEKEPQRAT